MSRSASPKKLHQTLETPFKTELLLALSKMPDTTVWVQNAGKARGLNSGGVVQMMPTGAADIGGVVRVGSFGQLIQIETKVQGRHQTKAQRQWQSMCERRGAVYLLASFDHTRSMGENVEEVVMRIRMALAIKRNNPGLEATQT